MPSFESQIIKAIENLDIASVAVQRVRTVSVTPEPEAIRFRFNTTVATSPIIEVFELQTNFDAAQTLNFEGAKLVRVAFDFLGLSKGTRHAVRMDGLEQEKAYMFRITAGGGAGTPSVITGRARTGRRDVVLFAREIGIWDDGDPGIFYGEGELEFGFGLYGRDDQRLAHREFSCEAESGDLIQWPFGRGERGRESSPRVRRAPDSLTVYVLGVENDSFIAPFHPWAEPPLQLPPSTTTKRSSDWVKSDAMQRFDLPTQTGEYRLAVDLRPPPFSLHYFVTGWLEVRVKNPPASRIIGQLSTPRLAFESATLPRGAVAVIGSEDSADSSNVWLGADGALSVGMRQDGSREVDWRRVSEEPIDEVVAVKSGDNLNLVARFGGDLRRSTVHADGSVASPWATALAFSDEAATNRTLRGPMTLAHGSNGVAIAVPGAGKLVVTVLSGDDFLPEFGFTVADSSCTVVALAWTSDKTLGLVGLRSSGMGLVAGWQLSSGATTTQWTELDAPLFDAITLVPATDDEPAVIVGLTIERELLVRRYGVSDEAGRWESAGYLDQLSYQVEQGKTDEAAGNN